jgi:MFS family permease
VIHDYFVFLSFLSLGFILASSASFLEARRVLASSTAEDNESLRFRRRARSWRKITILFIVTLIFSRFVIIILGPSEIVTTGFFSLDYIRFFLLAAILSILWIIALHLTYLQRYLKPEVIEKFQDKVAIYRLILVVLDLVITGFYFLAGFTGLFEPSPSGLSSYHYVNPENFLYMIVIVFILLAVLILFYILFLFKRSLSFLNQYLIAFMILLSSCVIFAITGTSQFLGWYESLDSSIKILSFQYGYFGWIYISFFGISIYSTISTLIILFIKSNFLDVSRIRLILLPMLKTGFVSLIAFALLTVTPVILTLL